MTTESRKLTQDDALAFLRSYGGLHRVKDPTQYMAGFRSASGLEMALVRTNKTPSICLSPGNWLEAVRGELLAINPYDSGAPRNSNLAANAPSLAPGNPMVQVSVPNLNALRMLCEAYTGHQQAPAATQQLTPEPTAVMPMPPLNQILFGPPGTGKTFSTIDAALAILDPGYLGEHQDNRGALKARFDGLVHERRIRFVTFHQSFSYEDFVEGLRAHLQDGQLQYRVEAGVFRQLCEDAGMLPGQRSLDDVLNALLEELAEQKVAMQTSTGKGFNAGYMPGKAAITCFPDSSEPGNSYPANVDDIRSVLRGQPAGEVNFPSYVRGIANVVRQRHSETEVGATHNTSDQQPYVLIIDEINRGNISRVFGELITLIEDSKRAGRAECLEVVLPYSKLPFSVPDNVYLIGTMNTADRSLTGLDVALRRRFVFKEMPPRPELLDSVVVNGGIPMGTLLRVVNQRIEALLTGTTVWVMLTSWCCTKHPRWRAWRRSSATKCCPCCKSTSLTIGNGFSGCSMTTESQ